MSTKHTPKTFLSRDQVWQLNEKHGWFQFGDAQSDVSNAFANDAIAMHENMRQAAPELFEALVMAMELLQKTPDEFAMPDHPVWGVSRKAISKATGEQA